MLHIPRPLFSSSNERDQSRAFSSRLPLKKKESAFTLRKLAASDSSSLQFYLRLSLILFNSLQTYLTRKPVPRSLILSASPETFPAHCSNSQAISRVSHCHFQHNSLSEDSLSQRDSWTLVAAFMGPQAPIPLA